MVKGKGQYQSTLVGRYLKPLREYIGRRLRFFAETEGWDATILATEEIVNETVATALRRRGHEGGISLPWLRELARAVIGREVERVRKAREREVSLDTPVTSAQAMGGGHPDEELTLADLIPDLNADLPAEVYEDGELWACVDRSFDELPPPWREIFFLHAVDGLTLDEVAARQGRPVEAIIHSVSQTREHLRYHLLKEFGDLLEVA